MKTCKDCNLSKDEETGFYRCRAQWQPYCKGCYKLRQRVRQREIKAKVVSAYGLVCYCCEESDVDFLSLDHIYRDGNVDGKRGSAWYQKLIRLGFPSKDRLRVSCFNCNMGREANGGVCPHVRSK